LERYVFGETFGQIGVVVGSHGAGVRRFEMGSGGTVVVENDLGGILRRHAKVGTSGVDLAAFTVGLAVFVDPEGGIGGDVFTRIGEKSPSVSWSGVGDANSLCSLTRDIGLEGRSFGVDTVGFEQRRRYGGRSEKIQVSMRKGHFTASLVWGSCTKIGHGLLLLLLLLCDTKERRRANEQERRASGFKRGSRSVPGPLFSARALKTEKKNKSV